MWSLSIISSRAFSGVSGIGGNSAKLYSLAGVGCVLGSITAFQVTHNEMLTGVIATGAILLSALLQLQSSKGSTTALLPIVDSCNHKSVDYVGVLAFEPDSNNYIVRATRQVPPNTQITISYGDRNNDDLLQYFGFVEADNGFDRYIVISPLTTLQLLLQENDATTNIGMQQLRSEVARIKAASEIKDSALVVTKTGGIESWTLGGLAYLNEQFRRPALKNILNAEIQRLQAPLDAESIESSRLALINSFMAAKVDILQRAIKSL
jgi:hypothetical protein